MEANKQDHRTSSPLIAVALPHVSSQPPSSQTDNEAQGPTLCMRHDFRIFSNTRCRQITGRSSSLMFIVVRCALDFLLHSSSARCLCFRFLNTTYIYIYTIYIPNHGIGQSVCQKHHQHQVQVHCVFLIFVVLVLVFIPW